MLMLIQTSNSHSDVLNISSNPLHVLQTSVSHIISPLISSGGAKNNETRLNIEHCCSQFANFPAAPSLNIFEEPNIAAGQPVIGEWLQLAEHCASCIYIMSRYIYMYIYIMSSLHAHANCLDNVRTGGEHGSAVPNVSVSVEAGRVAVISVYPGRGHTSL